MNRSNRTRQQNSRGFVSGGVYDPNQTPKPLVQYPSHQQQQQQQNNVHRQQQQNNHHQQQQQQQQLQQQQQQAQEENYQHEEVEEEVEMKPETGNALRVDELLENGKLQFKKIFQNRKKSSERARQKKIRQNRQLRKAMLPKNALMALNELKGVVISDFIVNNNVGGGFTAVVTVNDVQYEGLGSSKMSSKSNACEKALRDIILAKMAAKPKKSTSEAAAPTKESVAEVAEAMDTTEDAQSENDNPEDDVPMINLASFAIFKLFSDWEKEGFFVPEMHPQQQPATPGSDTSNNTAAAAPKEPKKLPIRSELPPNWETMHPATLLCMMRPGINYVDFGQVGEKPNVLQRLGVNVDDRDFEAEGRSKKIARRNVAVNVCNTLFGTNFSVSQEAA